MKKISFLLLLLAVLFTGGCGSASLFLGGAGAVVQGYIYWKEGEAHKYYQYDADIMYKATKRALDKMNLPIKEDKLVPAAKSHRGTIPGHRMIATSNNKFKIKIISREKNVTEIAIRIDFMGDKPYAELIYAHIDRQVTMVEFPDKPDQKPDKKPNPPTKHRRR